ncbi:MAG: tetratricopeptide repeat protein [Deltaproteobacteria bacterium]|jgi:Flp pilus assembly protein TadD|nr:tetratricopeptide repeat protein [Deltaproteobacteria bacterium]
MLSWPPLWPRDLVRFSREFKKTLTRFLPNYEFQVGPTPEPNSELAAPLAYLGRALGYVSVNLKPGQKPAPASVLALWPSLADSALENLALRKALQKDPESGLYNRRYFLGRLRKNLRDRQRLAAEANQALTREIMEPPALLVAIVDFGPGNFVLDRRTARILATRKAQCLARLDRDRLGLLMTTEPTAGRDFLEEYQLTIRKRLPDLNPTIGYALYPKDLPWQTPSQEIKDILLARAETALFVASSHQAPASIIGFGELVERYGHLTQILPQNRVALNLGRAMGAMAGQIYAIKGRAGEPKGEIAIFETAENYSLANVTSGETAHLSAGDVLSFSRFESPKEPLFNPNNLEDQTQKQEFMDSLTRQASSGQELTVALMAIDDWEKMETLVGPEEMEKRLAQLNKAVDLAGPYEAATVWGPGTLAVIWREVTADLDSLLAKIRSKVDFPFSSGVIDWPSPVIKPNELLVAARKALLEASMTGPATIIKFGPQCLNISGDNLFEAGDLAGAMEEYQRGLTLDPNHLNLLNSLGVCHGRLGDHRAALMAFDQALALDPENLMALFNKGCSLILDGRLEEAVAILGQAASLPSPGFETLYQYGRLTLSLGQLDKALPILRQAASLKESRGAIYRYLGQAELLNGDSDKALEAFKKAVKDDPDDAKSLSSLGVLFLERANEREVALSLFQRSVEIEPTNSLFRQRLGKLLYDLGDIVGARRHLRAAVEFGCRAPEIHRRLEDTITQGERDERLLASQSNDRLSGQSA